MEHLYKIRTDAKAAMKEKAGDGGNESASPEKKPRAKKATTTTSKKDGAGKGGKRKRGKVNEEEADEYVGSFFLFTPLLKYEIPNLRRVLKGSNHPKV